MLTKLKKITFFSGPNTPPNTRPPHVPRARRRLIYQDEAEQRREVQRLFCSAYPAWTRNHATTAPAPWRWCKPHDDSPSLSCGGGKFEYVLSLRVFTSVVFKIGFSFFLDFFLSIITVISMSVTGSTFRTELTSAPWQAAGSRRRRASRGCSLHARWFASDLWGGGGMEKPREPR